MKPRVLATALAVCAASCVLVACGSGGTTTVIKEQAPRTVEKTTTVQVPAPRPKPAAAPAHESAPAEPAPRSAPNVIGLPLPEAEEILSEAGFKTYATNTDTTFGIVVRSHYTICKQSKPRGNRVTVLAQKYGC